MDEVEEPKVVDPVDSSEIEILKERVTSLIWTNTCLRGDVKYYSTQLQKHLTRKAKVKQILESTILRVYRVFVSTYDLAKFHRCQDCRKRIFRTSLYKEHETYARIYLCPNCLISANRLPRIKFVKVNLSR